MEPRPLTWPVKRLKKRSEWPVDEARLVFDAAVQYVSVGIDCDALADWKWRQGRLKGWLEVLRREPSAVSVERFGPSMIVGESVGRGELEALVDDVAELLAEAGRRCDETERMHRAVGSALRRVGMIMKRCVERRAEIGAATEERLQQISPEDTAAQQAAIEAAYPDLIVLSETACEQINAQTRRVLDAHRRTAAMPVWQFWEMAYRDLIEG